MDSAVLDHCLLCGSVRQGQQIIRHRRDPRVSFAVRWVMCPECGLVYQSRGRSGQERSLYDREYRQIPPEIYARQSSPVKSAASIALWIGPRLGPGRALDIGCAAGNLLDELASLGWETYGVEPTKTYADYAAQRHRVVAGYWDDRMFPGLSFDLVLLSHVIEHVDEPRAMLGGVRGRLSSRGWIFLETPDLLRPSERLWDSFLAAEHLSLYSEATFRRLCVEAGFQVEAYETCWRGHRLLARPGDAPAVATPDYTPGEVRRRLRRAAALYPFRSWRRWTLRAARRVGELIGGMIVGRERTHRWIMAAKIWYAKRLIPRGGDPA